MCGIFAALSRRGPISTDYAPILEGLRHRGPDDGSFQLLGLRCDPARDCDRVWLGHRRLSIIDLSARGRQPMTTPDGRLTIIFNGEIYNFIELREQCRLAGACFVTESDTEVLLHAWRLWGEDCLTRLKGMFAFVIVDREAGTATLVRDFFGIKPLYYAVTEQTLLVSSEIFPLLQTGEVGAELDPEIAYEYLRFGATMAVDRTILREIRQLPGAHVAVFDFRTGALSMPRAYWALHATNRAITFKDAVAECRERFLDNVRLHLRSDVPVGAALSGGIDSSSIVCAMRLLEPELELKTFSYIPADPSKSEEHWVDLVHAKVGGECHKIRPTGAELSEDLELLVRRQGEPFASASIFAQFRVFQRARAEGVPVTMDGQGADELLGGYWPHVGTRAAERLRHGDVLGMARLTASSGTGIRGAAMMGGMLAQSLLPPRLRAMARSLVGRSVAPSYLDVDWLAAQDVDVAATADAMIGRYRTLKEHLVESVTQGSLPPLLRYADRNSMAASIESRVPFLTHDFAEFLLSLPPEYLISPRGVRKHVFREAMAGILPEPIRQRQDKIGFFADDGLWLRQNRERFEEIVDELGTLPLFRSLELTRFFADFWAGRHTQAALVWRAVVFGYWRREVEKVVRARRS